MTNAVSLRKSFFWVHEMMHNCCKNSRFFGSLARSRISFLLHAVKFTINLEMYWKRHFLASVHSHYCGTFLWPAPFISSLLFMTESTSAPSGHCSSPIQSKNKLFILSFHSYTKTDGTNSVLQFLYWPPKWNLMVFT